MVKQAFELTPQAQNKLDAGLPSFESRPVETQPSTAGRHSTLFEDFSLVAVATYNFYTVDELQERPLDPSSSLASLPRYVTLTWKTPTNTKIEASMSDKRVRPASLVDNFSTVPLQVVKTSLANGYISPGVITTSLVVPQMNVAPAKADEDTFLASTSLAGASAALVLQKPPLQSFTTTSKVQFIDPSIAGAINPIKIATATTTQQLTSIGSLSSVLSSLEVISEFNQDVPLRNPPPEFPAQIDLPPVFYVGYTIERHEMGPDGSMKLSAVFDIDDVKKTSFIDRGVAYSKTYTYRIRALVQWTRPKNVTFDGILTTSLLKANDTGKVASYLSGDWSEWATVTVADLVRPNCPDELTVTPRSHAGTLRVSWKVPHDPQLDIDRFVLLRSRSIDGRIEDWVVVKEFPATNGSYDDTDIETYEARRVRYVYAMYSLSKHDERSTLTEQISAAILKRFDGRELPVIQRSIAGVELNDYGIRATLPIVHEWREITFNNKITLYCRNASGASSIAKRVYVVAITSLTTGEVATATVTLLSTDVGRTNGGRA